MGHPDRTTPCSTGTWLNGMCCDDRWNPRRGMFGDVGDPQLVGRQPVELAVHQVIGGGHTLELLHLGRAQ